MSLAFSDFPKIIIRVGKESDRPARPPSRHAGWWDNENSLLYIANEALNWILINSGGGGESSGLAMYVLDFDFSTLAVTPILTTVADQTIFDVRMNITTPFDNTISMHVGESGNTSRLMSSSQNDPFAASEYRTSPDYTYAGISVVNLYIDSNTATVGAGTIYLMTTLAV